LKEVSKSYKINKEKLYLKHWGIHPIHFQETKLETPANIDHSKLTILSPRNCSSKYNIHSIIKAFKVIEQRHNNIQLIILLGAANKHSNYFKRIQSLNKKGNIIIIDKMLSQLEMKSLYQISKLFISIPKSDQLALTILEGMANKSIPILANHRTYKEHLKEDVNAIYTKDNSAENLSYAINKILDNPRLENKIIDNNKKLVKKFGSFEDNLQNIMEDITNKIM
jgi:glycosyltransferase involved in cell wall biosynthesis